ncbi:Gfo/Idh/MocA family oxidoreductase [Anaerocolumna aminovalerica]|jgi:scyllo-inositol 2-dehydrogenase (NADP+)|uniref:Predicted dehydrogenase n=1 Tax=Anaerocolumna aminovalerica TaxID=1527 RepID=A0A1I5IPE6_9FIRM|nr:Gfo/Idh/MocA family oxidoreductase [Anaerocolumna aminovalerica]MDU6266572.1 Gfo/Idh/MocA family oxidoreductase [Anaerocolumna aminovalerica]SFO62498.1 Predicted dehydrogenase [Anaerocolumna aminovalerica]
MEKKKLNIAIIGYGGMGSWHVRTLSHMNDANLCGIWDIDPDRREAAAADGIHVYGSQQELLDDLTVEAITIATPNDTHLPIALAAMGAGKHVICEKPVALNSNELTQMVNCSRERGVLFTVHQNRRWDEDYLIVKKLYDQQTMGKVFNIESRVHGSRGIPSDWRNQKEHGGGMVLDWGVHLLDQMNMMLGRRKPRSVFAQLTNVTNEGVDDGFRAIFQFDHQLTFLAEVGTSNFISMPRWYIQGENGTAVIHDWELNGEIVMVSDWEKRDAVPVVTAAGLTKTMAPRTDETVKKYPLPEVHSDIGDFYRNVRACIHEGAQLLVGPEEVMEVMYIMEAIFRSAEQNCVVYL